MPKCRLSEGMSGIRVGLSLDIPHDSARSVKCRVCRGRRVVFSRRLAVGLGLPTRQHRDGTDPSVQSHFEGRPFYASS
ncbi:hypothetical protein PSTT_08664 [Puccinia striiformis]|uniref:Uncharacterized protein n=1 Tax=Puccinia striiformis TaxID=27350 RepID=A0A2S4VBA0_9BASI|nr:hypothetical protein PSTT_08664 [Puccinia striiformis]